MESCATHTFSPDLFDIQSGSTMPQDNTTAADTRAPRRPHVLLVDDRPENLLALEAVLEYLDCQLVKAVSGREALKHLLQHEFAVILLDVQMPGMDGYETAALIKQREASRHIPIVFITAINTEPSHVFQGYASGAVDYIVKPFEPDILRSKVGVFLDLWRKTELIRQQAELLRQSEQREAERLLAESAAELDRFKPPLEAILDGLFMFEAQTWRLSYLNAGAMRRLGYHDGGLEEIEGKTVLDILPEFDETRLRTLVTPLTGEAPQSLVVETVLRRRDGEQTPFEILLQFVKPARAEGRFVATLRDISERRKAAIEIQKQMQRMMALHHIDSTISASSDVRITLNVILDEVTKLLNADAAVLLLNAHTQELEYVTGCGFKTEALQHTRLRVGQGYAGRAALERHVVAVSNLQESPGTLASSPLLAEENFIGYYAVPLIAKGQVQGVLEVFQRSVADVEAEWLNFLEILAGQAAIAIDNATLFDDVQRSNLDLISAYDTTLEGWSRALDLRDQATEGHTLRVTEVTMQLAQAMGTGAAELIHIRRGALLHDIGKMGIPDSILLKPGPLTEEEWEIMRRHPVYAFDLLSPIAFLRPALDIPHYHHEKWDGSGYPNGLKGEQIPLAARLFAVVDVWDALRSDRPYRAGWPIEQVREQISKDSGTHFDPQVVEAFSKLDML
jgi:PAS domain S-box-containing protein/putative nucleotidyltransferase with HDIG domain